VAHRKYEVRVLELRRALLLEQVQALCAEQPKFAPLLEAFKPSPVLLDEAVQPPLMPTAAATESADVFMDDTNASAVVDVSASIGHAEASGERMAPESADADVDVPASTQEVLMDDTTDAVDPGLTPAQRAPIDRDVRIVTDSVSTSHDSSAVDVTS
jgi:hypothetical protein